jgi:hypothetical protein
MGMSGQDDQSGHTSPANWTDLGTSDYSTQTVIYEYYNIVASADVTFGQTQTADDYVSIGVAVGQSP